MMEEWIRSHFVVTPNAWITMSGTTEDSFIFGTIEASLPWVVSRFGPETPTSAASLKALDPLDQLGWHKHFDAWATAGILPAT